MNVPVAVGVPLIVMVLLFHTAFSPAGSPAGAPIPVAPVVVKVIEGDNTSLIQTDLGVGAVTVLINTVIVPVAVTVAHPPVSGME